MVLRVVVAVVQVVQLVRYLEGTLLLLSGYLLVFADTLLVFAVGMDPDLEAASGRAMGVTDHLPLRIYSTRVADCQLADHLGLDDGRQRFLVEAVGLCGHLYAFRAAAAKAWGLAHQQILLLEEILYVLVQLLLRFADMGVHGFWSRV